MATYTWSFGAAGSGLQFTVTYDSGTHQFTVRSLEGSFDLNALWFSNGDGKVDGNVTLSKADNSLNMNGANTVWSDDGSSSGAKIVWDGYQKLSNPGLGAAGTDKATFIAAGESYTFDAAAGFSPEGTTLGVRATSVNGSDSIKWVDREATVQTAPPPWGPNPFVVDASAAGLDGTNGNDGVPGAEGVAGYQGAEGVDGSDGSRGADGINAVGTGNGKTVAQPGSSGTAGEPGLVGGNGGDGGDGGNGGNGGPGTDGQPAIILDPAANYSALLIDASAGPIVILGGNGGDGGDGGDGGAGGRGGDGGTGGDGGNGGNGGAGGNGSTAQGYKDGANGGNGGSGGAGGAGGDGGPGGNGGDGGDGGNGGNGAVAIVNGGVTNVYIIGSHDVTILGGKGGAAGDGGAGGEPGLGGDGGDGGNGGTGGSGGAGGAAGPGGKAGSPGQKGANGALGADGDVGVDGQPGTAGADGAPGADAPAFSDPVVVDATAHSGYLKISGSNGDDVIKIGSGGSTIYDTQGVDTYYLGSGKDVVVFGRHDLDDVDVIHGFDATQGDALDIKDLLEGYGGGDLTGWVNLAESGSDTTVQVDRNGGGDGYQDVAVLVGVTGLNVSQLLSDGNLLV